MRKTPRFELEDDAVTGINVTPLVDVCLVLVIIFMVATPLLSQPAFEVDLAAAATQEGQEEDKVTVSLGSDGRMAIGSQEYTRIDELEDALPLAIARTESGLVVIRADKNALHGLLTEIMARAMKAGARQITIATEQKKR